MHFAWDLLGLLHFREFAAFKDIEQSSFAPFLCCCLPLLLQLHDSYLHPPPSLKALLNRFPPQQIQACKQLGRIAGDLVAVQPALETVAAARDAAAEGPAAPSSAAEAAADPVPSAAAAASGGLANLDEAEPVTFLICSEDFPAATKEKETFLSALWECGGPGRLPLAAKGLSEAFLKFQADIAAVSAAADAAKDEAIAARALESWGSLLPLLLPLLYYSLPDGPSEASPLTCGAARAQRKRQQKHQQQRRQQQQAVRRQAAGHRPFSARTLHTALETGCCRPFPEAAGSEAAAAPKEAAAAGATRGAALRLCAAAVANQWRRLCGGPLEGPYANGQQQASKGLFLSQLLLNSAWEDPAFFFAKPFLSLVLNSPTMEDAIHVKETVTHGERLLAIK